MSLLRDFLDWLFRRRPPVPPTPPPPGPPTGDDLLAAVNRERPRPFRADPRLQAAAMKHAEWMRSAGVLSHTGQGGSTPGTRALAAGYAGSAIAENIAAGQRTAAEVVTDWIRSPGHRANILGDYADAGTGHAGDYWCLLLGRP
jgi:uncharacterized protein YkwD